MKLFSEFSYLESWLITMKDIFCTKSRPSLLFLKVSKVHCLVAMGNRFVYSLFIDDNG